MSELNLNPSYTSFSSLCRRADTRRQHMASIRKKNIHRRARRQRLMRERRYETFSELKEDAATSPFLLDLKSSGNLPRRHQPDPERDAEEGEEHHPPGVRQSNAARFLMTPLIPPKNQMFRQLVGVPQAYATHVKDDNRRPKRTVRSMGKRRSTGLDVTTVTAGSTSAARN